MKEFWCVELFLKYLEFALDQRHSYSKPLKIRYSNQNGTGSVLMLLLFATSSSRLGNAIFTLLLQLTSQRKCSSVRRRANWAVTEQSVFMACEQRHQNVWSELYMFQRSLTFEDLQLLLCGLQSLFDSCKHKRTQSAKPKSNSQTVGANSPDRKVTKKWVGSKGGTDKISCSEFALCVNIRSQITRLRVQTS